jgi:hypothetical protein
MLIFSLERLIDTFLRRRVVVDREDGVMRSLLIFTSVGRENGGRAKERKRRMSLAVIE